MQFTNFTVAALSAFLFAGNVAAKECHARENCCYSSEGACRRQLGLAYAFIGGCSFDGHDQDKLTLCEQVNVTRKDCDADCCDIQTKKGRGCPKEG
ncbi:hypothetical protein HBI56_090060 [Parastagonospora nodorum]|uniref:Uncharacterized protein n=2 Tax=Phaeosphaeria nodorum (strain SN15 / ATCC MYA-4574 / FGSC 10173) TaxID=321614 RepID=A0A7U2FDI1_PHANO|nr:hypothetical protein SNOG_10044 [Parastagonospora nodorum SN15]KAH3912929.1 hypothetical protein HBH56_109420 [Parastagonospora nodorum]EAT82379.1 hypothetical protein SNOG_10044 [Parastagonospora nodorum SN15]KAH3922319.1 hypothetical protein HBH54_226520 [Parastagonospora nodorum]KAH3974405.1 hypothetical protein HBH51_093120 [Parastagonospora nodorum]KAH3978991.1 hypothetical protein HBH52_101090 [Parastagonospora nodorum]